MKYTYNYIKNQIYKENYKLLSKEYINSKIKLKVECPEGHQYYVTYNCFYRGQRCPICYGKQRLTYDFINKEIIQNGYKLLSEKYINSKTKLKVECSEGHQYYVTYNNFYKGSRCPICYNKIRVNVKRFSYDFIKSQIEKEGYKLLSKEYKNANTKLKVECSEGHQYYVKYGNFQQRKRCPICYDIETYSQAEKDCLDIVRQIIPDKNVIENDRTQIVNPKTGRYLELDIYIPSLNKAIEFNGEYWHKSNYSKFKDNQKIKQCKKRGIDLLTISYQDWVNNRERQIEKLRINI